MKVKNQEVLRMELQVGELIRIVANLNERVKRLEDQIKHTQLRRIKQRGRILHIKK